MRAAVISSPGGPEVLKLKAVEDPAPARGEVLVRVRATAVNRVDILQRMGRYPAPADAPQDIPGVEFAGDVEALGEGVADIAIGDRVFGLAGGGTYADLLVVHWRTLARIPERLSYQQAAAVPEAFITAYDAMVCQGRLQAGETVLIHAAGSGVGTAAVQIAELVGARSLGTSRTTRKLDLASRLGLSAAIVPAEGRFADEVCRLTSGRGVDLVLELVGGDYLKEDLACLAAAGRLVLVGLVGGARVDLDLLPVLSKRLEIRGTVLRSRPLEEKIMAMRAFTRHVLPALEAGRLRPVVDRVYTFDQAPEAHRYVESNESLGKVVIAVNE